MPISPAGLYISQVEEPFPLRCQNQYGCYLPPYTCSMPSAEQRIGPDAHLANSSGARWCKTANDARLSCRPEVSCRWSKTAPEVAVPEAVQCRESLMSKQRAYIRCWLGSMMLALLLGCCT